MRAGQLARSLALGALLAVSSGCDGSFDCPIDVPDCCDNVVFGCGLFDLPMGCTCEQYGRALHHNIAALASSQVTKSLPSRGLNGTWSGILKRSSSTCPSFLANVRGVIGVSERKGVVTVFVPGYGRLRGKVRGSGYTVSGSYTPARSSCRAQLRAVVKRSGPAIGNVQLQVNYTCRARSSCASQYRGTLQKRT